MQFEKLSRRYSVRRLNEADALEIYALYQTNPQYFEAMSDIATLESTRADLTALPPNKTYEDKYYLGFYDSDALVAVMDLILAFPNQETAFIGLFMVQGARQGKGIGSSIVSQALYYLKETGFSACRLGYVKTNSQSKYFWEKNGFLPTGVQSKQEKYTIVLMEKKL